MSASEQVAPGLQGFSAEREARRTALILAAAQAIIGSAAPICFALGALAGHYMLGMDKSLATAPLTGFNVGVALGALPAAAIIRRLGQRDGFLTGTGLTALGGLIATIALFLSHFWLFAFGLAIVGFGGAFVQQFRFAAADNAPPAFKARAISFVLAGGVFTALLGPQVVIFTKDLFQPVAFAGAFASLVVLAAIGALVLLLLRPRPFVEKTEHLASTGRPLRVIVTRPRFVTALTCAVGSYAMMTFVMTGAPLAMVGCGFSPDEATLGISWHIMAMYVPSFFTGRLIHRFGASTIVAVGFLLLIGCGLIALSGLELWQFWLSLILLGLGWNFGFIGATAIVSECYTAEENGKVQGFHDFVLFSTVAFGSLMSGVVYNVGGWDMLAWLLFPVCGLCLAMLALQAVIDRRAQPV
ncbi:MFS transporter [Aquamicrobium segne]|uniref:MFS transporter n=1 Tax=Aquamicrobium segne TaxID=469547 RepID=A0ABW0GZP0_9HYPH